MNLGKIENFSINTVQGLVIDTWNIFTTPILELSGNKISVLSIFTAAIFFYFSTVLSKYAQQLAKKILDNRNVDRGVKGSIIKIAGHVAQFLGILIALDMIGVNLNSLVALGGVLAVGIGFGLQNIAQNFISGLIILFERPIKSGDLVEVDGVYGRISEIGSRSTTVTTREDVSIIVPNSKFISERVVNDSFSGERRRFAVKVGVAYGSDVKKVTEVLNKIAMEHDKVLKQPMPEVFFNDFGDSSLDFELTVWINDLWASVRILSDIRYLIDEAFREHEIEIPFPQRVVTIKK